MIRSSTHNKRWGPTIDKFTPVWEKP